MPRFDGTGPMGYGAGTGWGIGPCGGGCGWERGIGRGFRRFWGYRMPVMTAKEKKEYLKEEAEALKKELKAIEKEIEESKS